MNAESILAWANDIASKQAFTIEKELYRGVYYKQDHIRNVIFLGVYKSKPAVLKVYNDPRFTDEPSSLNAFLESNTSTKLLAPQLYAYEEVDDHRGWFIMEYLDKGSFLTTPLKAEEKALFLKLYSEYKQHWPTIPHRQLTKMEQKDSYGYTKQKLDLWEKDFIKVDNERTHLGQTTFNTPEFQSLYSQCLSFLKSSYNEIPLEWVHGHFKPQELFIADNGTCYLTDFAHTKMVPRGYELAFIIWADYIMSTPLSTPYNEWKKGVEEWIHLMTPYLANISLTEQQFQAAIMERIIGTLLRDYGSSDKPIEQIQQMFTLGMQYLQEVVN